MTNSLARLISYIFSPIVVLVFVPFFLIYRKTQDFYMASMWTLYTALFLLGMVGFILLGVKRKIFTDMDVSKKEQRPLLFFATIVCCLLYISGLFLMHGPQILFVIAFGIVLGIFVASIITPHIKASIHVATVSALIFAVAIIDDGWYALLLFLIPLVAWARIKIKRHTKAETIVGGVLGISLTLIIYILVKLI